VKFVCKTMKMLDQEDHLQIRDSDYIKKRMFNGTMEPCSQHSNKFCIPPSPVCPLIKSK